MNISVVGMGYVGLCTSACFADKGFSVVCLDIDESKIKLIKRGIPPIYEPDLSKLLKRGVSSGLLRVSTDWNFIIKNSDITFITVGTPSRDDGSIDLTHVKSACVEIGKSIKDKNEYHLVTVKSTVIPGATINIVKPMLEKYSGKECGEGFGLCSNPDFLRQGSAVRDILEPDKIVIGEYSKEVGDILEGLYNNFYKSHQPNMIRTSIYNAEIIKYANNLFLATKISFINEMANICELIPKADIKVVARALGLDRRINPQFLDAGLGFGGSCLTKDAKALVSFSKENNYDPKLLTAVLNVNRFQPIRAVELARKSLRCLKGRKIAVLGLSFKPDTNDIRESPALIVIRELMHEGAEVSVYDPKAMNSTKRIFSKSVAYASSVMDCIKNADCCILVTAWEEFKKLAPEDFKKLMKNPLVIDGRRIFDHDMFRKELEYYGIGAGAP